MALQEVDRLVVRLRATRSVFRLAMKTSPELGLDGEDCTRELESRGLKVWRLPERCQIPILLVRGQVPTGDRLVAVVGSRSVDAYGRACSREVARLVDDLGFYILSGGAEGCDAEAHRLAIDVGSPTIVVLGHGHDYTYPRHHQDLFDEVLRGGGALVSPYWPTVAPRSFRFRERNSVIAQLARAVVVVRARLGSGSLSTARFAKQFGRPVLAIPANVGDGYGVGCNDLLAKGAIPMTEPNQLAKTLGIQTNLLKKWPIHERGSPEPWPEIRLKESVSLSPDEEIVLGALKSDTILDLDALHVRSGLSVARLSACLLNLEIQGLVHRTESDEFCVR